ncbi:MAG: hypothetical protein GXY77_19635, partial [Fibrobacter sp.]|nr:hypothetical protein [Fibrobacter sp.]
WEKTVSSSRGYIIKGAIDNPQKAPSFPLPDYKSPSRYNTARTGFKFSPEKWHIGLLSGSTFELAYSLCNNYLSDLLSHYEAIRILHDRIDELLRDEICCFKAIGADSVMIIEDLAETLDVSMSLNLWHEEFKPRLKSLCAFVHDKNMKLFFHPLEQSRLVSEIIDSGVDCIQLDTPETIGLKNLEDLQSQYSVTFWCPLDINTVLPSKNEKFIRQKARDMIKLLWKGKGGFIAGYYWDNAALRLHPKWQDYGCDEFLKYGAHPFNFSE